MLELIHRYRTTFLGVVGVGAAALLMTSFGLAGSVGSSRAVAITIDGEEISLSEFERERSMTEENYRRVFGPDYQRFLAGMNLRQQVADSMIAGHLLKRTATSFDFVAASDGIRNAISTATGGQADPQRYAQLLRQIGMNARQFEARVSDQVLNTAFRSLLNDATFPSRAEALSSLVYRETSYDFEYIALDPTTFVENVSPPSEEELEEFYQEIVTDYEIPERIAYDYVTFNPEKFLDIVEVVDEEIWSYITRRIRINLNLLKKFARDIYSLRSLKMQLRKIALR